MANQQHLDRFTEEVEVWNQWRKEHPYVQPDFSEAHLEGTLFNKVDIDPERHVTTLMDLKGVSFEKAYLQGAWFNLTNLKETEFTDAHLEEAWFDRASLQEALFINAHLEKAHLRAVHLEGVCLDGAHLGGTDLRGAFFSNTTSLKGVTLSDEKCGAAYLVDINWGGVNLAVVDWAPVKKLGEEQLARRNKQDNGAAKEKGIRLREYREAVRANRQLAVALRDQGLNEEADRFAYRAQRLQRIVVRRQGLLPNLKLWQRGRLLSKYAGSLIIDIIAGYGYHPLFAFLWYALIICGFALLYYIFGHIPLSPDAFVFSLTSFHGRGFFPGLGDKASLHNPLVILAAAEAVIGLFIEISFIATFTQRYFGK
jgi:hypothetical protein